MGHFLVPCSPLIASSNHNGIIANLVRECIMTFTRMTTRNYATQKFFESKS
jgi:hypothetical protein